ncbi:MAG: antibiotic biosynthesis monooxygenase [Thiohalomonadales bacterium]
MYIVTNRVMVNPEFKQQFEERFRARAGQVDKQAGFVRMDVMRPLDEGVPFLVMTVWRDKNAFLAWVDSEDFKLAHQNPLPKEAYATGGGMEHHEIVVSSSTVVD